VDLNPGILCAGGRQAGPVVTRSYGNGVNARAIQRRAVVIGALQTELREIVVVKNGLGPVGVDVGGGRMHSLRVEE